MTENVVTYIVDGNAFESNDTVLTGRQIRQSVGLSPASDYVLIMIRQGTSQSIGLDETVDLSVEELPCFVSFKSDRVFSLTINERGFEWGAEEISASDIRIYGDIPDEHQLILDSKGDRPIKDDAVVSLKGKGVERLLSHPRSWKLKVQDIVLTITTPTIIVRDALVKAGIDPDSGWTVAIKYTDAPREAIGLNGIIDLTRKGIEKLWLRPANIQNGEGVSDLKRAFVLRDQDETYLSQSELNLETIVDSGRRWAILRNFCLPSGYTEERVDIAVEIPPTYPGAQLDMFYCHPHLVLKSGREIPQTQAQQIIQGKSYQRWSRHRQGATSWNPAKDSIITHIAIITESIAREVE